jgi:hypothetical protein
MDEEMKRKNEEATLMYLLNLQARDGNISDVPEGGFTDKIEGVTHSTPLEIKRYNDGVVDSIFGSKEKDA